MKPQSEAASEGPLAAGLPARLLPLFAVALPVGALIQIKLPAGPAGLAITLSDVVVAAAIPFIGLMLWRERSLRVDGLVPHLALWLLLPTAALTIGLAVGYTRIGFQGWAATRLIGWIVVLLHLLVAAWIASDTAARRLAVRTFVIGAVLIITLDFVPILMTTILVAPEKCQWMPPAFGLTPNPNAYAFMLLMTIAVVAVEMQRGYFGPPLVNTILVAAAVFALALTSSRSAWVAGAVVAVIALLFGWTRRVTLASGIIVGAIMAGLMIALLVCSGTTAVSDDVRALGRIATAPTTMDAPMIERLYSYRRAIDLFLEHPLLGAGLGAFLSAELARGSWALIIHSTPLWLLGETGLLGAGAFAALVIAVCVALIRHIRSDVPQAKADAKTALLLLLAFGVMSQAQELLYQRSLWIMLGLFLFSPMPCPPLQIAPAREPRVGSLRLPSGS